MDRAIIILFSLGLSNHTKTASQNRVKSSLKEYPCFHKTKVSRDIYRIFIFTISQADFVVAEVQLGEIIFEGA